MKAACEVVRTVCKKVQNIVENIVSTHTRSVARSARDRTRSRAIVVGFKLRPPGFRNSAILWCPVGGPGAESSSGGRPA